MGLLDNNGNFGSEKMKYTSSPNMPANYMNELTDAASLTESLQDSLINASGDYTSVFGNATTDFSNIFSDFSKEENNNSYFSYDNTMKDVYDDYEAYSYNAEYEDDEDSPNLTFEC